MEKTKDNTRSPLERFCWMHLEKEGVPFIYEKSFELLPSFSYTGTVLEKTPTKKKLHVKNNKFQNIEFTPDFIGTDWVLEVKGARRPDFNLRWKMFKNLIKEKRWLLLLPTNQQEVLVSIAIIKKWIEGDRNWDNERILCEYALVKQPPQKHTKPKALQTKKRKAGPVRKRRHDSSTSGFGSGLLIDESFYMSK